LNEVRNTQTIGKTIARLVTMRTRAGERCSEAVASGPLLFPSPEELELDEDEDQRQDEQDERNGGRVPIL